MNHLFDFSLSDLGKEKVSVFAGHFYKFTMKPAIKREQKKPTHQLFPYLFKAL